MTTIMEDLLKYAAIAATAGEGRDSGSNADYIRGPHWNPLEDDADAFDLLVRCQLTIGDYVCGDYHDWTVMVSAESRWFDGPDSYDHQEFYAKGDLEDCRAAFREAIVRTAYQMGRHYVKLGLAQED